MCIAPVCAQYRGVVNNRVVRIVMIVVGVIALLIGIVFGGQGLGVIPGSFMTGDRTWFYIGLGVAFVGVVLLLIALRRPKSGN
jgi:hypothetical protein